MFIVGLITVLLTIINNSSSSTEFNCLNNQHDDDFRCRFSIVTPYKFISNKDDSPLDIPGCEAKKIWLLIRHGTRYPKAEDIKKITDLSRIQRTILRNCQDGSCGLSDKQLELLSEWKFNVSVDDEMKLTKEGEFEMIELAERFQSRFPSLMPDEYDNSTYKFKFTNKQRTKESAKHFAIGLFGKEESKKVWYPVPTDHDPILRFYKDCKKWIKDVKKNPDTYIEQNKMKSSKIMSEILTNLTKRFNLQFDYETLSIIRLTCVYETAWHSNAPSPWCTILSPFMFEVLEFIDDLKHYWASGYAYKLSHEIACPAINDMFYFFNQDDSIKTTTYFAHSGTILKILSHLGIAKDKTPLVYHSFDTSKYRLWRTSFIDSFASNIAFIYYNCESAGPSILTMHQERIINFPDCPMNHPCPIDIAKKLFSDGENHCDLHQMCSIDT